MASPAVSYSFTNGTVADASQVNQNFTDIINGITDATKDLSISALTCAGNVNLNGNTTIGNSSGDDLTITASLASTIAVKTTASYGIGDSTHGLTGIYFGANSQTVRIAPSGSMSATWTLTLPTTAGTANYALTTDGSGNAAWTAWSTSNWLATSAAAGTVNPYNAAGVVYAGTYTPTPTSNDAAIVTTANITLINDFQYMRVGPVVTVSGTVNCNASAGGTADITITLPVTSNNFTGTGQASGSAVCGSGGDVTVNNRCSWVRAVSGAQTVRFVSTISNAGSERIHVHFTYVIV